MIHSLFLLFHRWVALAAGAVIFVVALSGSALVFEGALDRWLHPRLWNVAPGNTRLSLDSLVARASAVDPRTPVTGLTLPAVSGRAVWAQAGLSQVFVDPYTGAILGKRTVAEWNQTLPRRLHVFHVNLLASKLGGQIVGIATFIALLLVLSGLVIWWRDKIWRVRWSASWKRINFDLHHALGGFAALVLVIITLSGLAIHYDWLNRLTYKLDRSAPAPIPQQLPPSGSEQRISVDSLYRVATTALPGAQVMFLLLPPKADQPLVAAMRFPEDRTPGGRSRVIVDRFRGTVLLALNTREAEAGLRIRNALRSLHTGDILAGPTRAVWFAAALVLALQGVTGFVMWWNGRAARVARRSLATKQQ